MRENSKKIFISLQDATRYCDYSEAYLRLRARQKKLKAVKFGKSWFTKKEWIQEYVTKIEEFNTNVRKVKKPIFSKEFISLQEATKYCSYSQPYLRLRARQGKLKAVKFGKSWFIRKEWLAHYLDTRAIRSLKEINLFSSFASARTEARRVKKRTKFSSPLS